jgi:cytochrome b
VKGTPEEQGTAAPEQTGYPLWDLPTRVFHWLLVVCVLLAWVGHEFDNSSLHRYSGYTVLVLVVFRIAWGFLGSPHSRFSDFVRGPSTVRAYLRGALPPRPGHNPLGGWSVLVLLGLLLAQAVTGLFNSDGILFDGPFYAALDSDLADEVGEAHEFIFNVLLGFIALHVVAVLYYQWRRHDDLLGPMLHGGRADGSGGAPAPLWLALLLSGAAVALLWLALSMAPPPVSYW